MPAALESGLHGRRSGTRRPVTIVAAWIRAETGVRGPPSSWGARCAAVICADLANGRRHSSRMHAPPAAPVVVRPEGAACFAPEKTPVVVERREVDARAPGTWQTPSPGRRSRDHERLMRHTWSSCGAGPERDEGGMRRAPTTPTRRSATPKCSRARESRHREHEVVEATRRSASSRGRRPCRRTV